MKAAKLCQCQHHLGWQLAAEFGLKVVFLFFCLMWPVRDEWHALHQQLAIVFEPRYLG